MSEFLKSEAAGGIVLMLAALLALMAANSPLQEYYSLLLETPVEVRVGALEVDKPLLLWVNDGLMALFFFLIGLELKRELVEGELADKRNILLPLAGAIGGMALPALIYLYFNSSDTTAVQGWAIPTATDIAFALGVLALLGSRVPASIKIFLTSLAIFDDIGAVLIIAVFYTANISFVSLLVVAGCILVLFFLNRFGVGARTVYVLIGLVMWVATLKSGVHATLAGIVLAMFIPIKVTERGGFSPLKEMEHDLHATVSFFVLPAFAFANAGISLQGTGMEQLVHGVPLGIALGLFVGKQAGVFGCCWLAVKLKLSRLPAGMSWTSLYGAAALCGIGFTMSMFIGSLAFEETGVNRMFDERLGIILGSLLSGGLGYVVLLRCLPRASRV